jgi:AraC-like DNA-binding protein
VDQQTYFFNFGPIPDTFHVIFRLSLMLFYSFLCWNCYFSKKYRDFLERNKSNYPSAQRWIFFYLITITSNSIFSIIMKSKIFFLNSKSVLYSGDLISFCLLLGFDLLFAYAVFHPEILFGMPHFNRLNQPTSSENMLARSSLLGRLIRKQTNRILITEQNETEESEDAVTLVTVVSETEEPLLQPEIMQDEKAETEVDESVRKLITEMETYILLNQPYRQQEFNIASISEALKVPQHHIAYIFKHVLKKSFVDYRNELRVNHAIESIREGKHQDITIEAIGTDAGFSSRATFFAVFKKLTGKTPGQFAGE